MTDSLADLLGQPGPDLAGRVFGVVTGIVTNNEDPDGLGRVKVRFPWLADDAESPWARVAAPMSGKERGFYALPEVDDEVLVSFHHGRINMPVVLGGLWNATQKPPADNADKKNNIRVVKSRSGHLIRLDDTDGKEKIEVIDKSGKNKITIDTASDTLTLEADADIVVKAANGKVSISGKEVEIKATGGSAAIAGQSASVKADGELTLKGQAVNIN